MTQQRISLLLSLCLFSSKTIVDVKNVAARAHRKKMLIEANAQKDARAGRAEVDDIAKATRSVREVTVMEAPALARDLSRLA